MGGEVEHVLEAIARAAHRHDRPDLRARVEVAQARLADPACRVVVCGEFKKGKSSLVNALLGARVCATDADVATAIPTYVRHGERLEAHVLDEETPGSSRGAAVAAAELDTVATGHAGPSARALEIRLPRELLADGLVLVDTPGISGGLASTHAGIALRALAVADVLVFVTDAGAELGAAEIEFLTQAAALCPVVLGAVTRVDLYPQWRRIVAADADHLRAAGLSIDLFPLSAPLRHHGLREADRDLLLESGYPQLTARLAAEHSRVAGSGGASAAAVGASVVGQLVAELTAQRRALDADPAAQEQRQAWARAREQASDLRTAGSRWQQVLFDRMADLGAEVELDLTVRIRALRREASERIAQMPPARLAADLGPWLQQRTTELLLDHQSVARSHADQVADAVAEQFGSAATELRRGLDLGGDEPGAVRDIAFAPTGSASASRLDMGLVALRGGSAGAMITHAAGLVLGLAFPVVLPAALVLSTVLAGKSWQSAQKAQLRALRADTDRAVAGYLEEVDTAARKDTRDAVRRLQRRLRETFSARASELFTTATRSAESLSTSLTGDDETRATRRAELDAELDALRGLQREVGVLLADLLPVPA
ncbi:dynamin family protein [Cellulomonas sp. Leaf334]|uniref:dynamin family protein n=1 Tax=Cellulomonas sp. Leaf334 TaxID=1736339 RepID=UPI0006FE788E|nr:dynamin family protein [Cellulomonas sp. Leaf334]